MYSSYPGNEYDYSSDIEDHPGDEDGNSGDEYDNPGNVDNKPVSRDELSYCHYSFGNDLYMQVNYLTEPDFGNDDTEKYELIDEKYVRKHNGILFVNDIGEGYPSDHMARRFEPTNVITTNRIWLNFPLLSENPDIFEKYKKMEYNIELLDINIKVSNFAKNIEQIKLRYPFTGDISSFIATYNQYHKLIPDPQINILLSAFDNLDTEADNIRNNENLLKDMLLYELILLEYLIVNVVHLMYAIGVPKSEILYTPTVARVYKEILRSETNRIEEFVIGLVLLFLILQITSKERDTLFFIYYPNNIIKMFGNIANVALKTNRERAYTGLLNNREKKLDNTPCNQFITYTLDDIINSTYGVDIELLNTNSIYQIPYSNTPYPMKNKHEIMNYQEYTKQYIVKKDAFEIVR
jgi:hypothetical protein